MDTWFQCFTYWHQVERYLSEACSSRRLRYQDGQRSERRKALRELASEAQAAGAYDVDTVDVDGLVQALMVAQKEGQ